MRLVGHLFVVAEPLDPCFKKRGAGRHRSGRGHQRRDRLVSVGLFAAQPRNHCVQARLLWHLERDANGPLGRQKHLAPPLPRHHQPWLAVHRRPVAHQTHQLLWARRWHIAGIGFLCPGATRHRCGYFGFGHWGAGRLWPRNRQLPHLRVGAIGVGHCQKIFLVPHRRQGQGFLQFGRRSIEPGARPAAAI